MEIGDRVFSDGDLYELTQNSTELRTADFHLTEVRPLQFDTMTHGGHRTHGVVVIKFQDVGNSTFFTLRG